MSDWPALKKELLANPETRAAYDARKAAYDLASKIIALRKQLDLSQTELAHAAGMTQPEIARIEAGGVSPRWATVARLFDAVGAELELKLNLPDGKQITVTPS